MEPVPITASLSIPAGEISFTVSRSGGPGGQHVNKVSTRVTLFFDVAGSPSLTPEQKDLISSRLASRLSHEGVLHIACQRHRSQTANRLESVERFAALLARALAQAPPRRKTKLPRAVRERRLEEKKMLGVKKRQRRVRPTDGD